MGEAGKTYWLDRYTGTTWKEFRNADPTITGFRAARRKTATKLTTGNAYI